MEGVGLGRGHVWCFRREVVVNCRRDGCEAQKHIPDSETEKERVGMTKYVGLGDENKVGVFKGTIEGRG